MAAARKAKAPRRVSANASGDGDAASLLRDLHFEEADGRMFVELTSLARIVQKKQHGDKALQATWRRAGCDDLVPACRGVRRLAFPKQKGHPGDKLMPAADLDGLQAYVKELDQDAIDSNAELLNGVAVRLGGARPELRSRHSVMELGHGARVHVTVTGGRPCMVLTLLLHAFGLKAARNYTDKRLIPYFKRVGVPVEAEHTN